MRIINSSAQLQELCSEIDKCKRFALDLEFIPERTYIPELCLVQVATDEGTHIVDPIQLQDLSLLWQRVANPDILVVLHAAEQDLDLIHNLSGLIPQNIFDTQIAAGFVGFGYPTGYSKLISSLLNISLSKTESYTDWSHRPLSESQVEYAIDDVKHLLPVYDILQKDLLKENRLEWAKEECERYHEPTYYQHSNGNEFLKIKGANGLPRRGLAVLRELCTWRIERAMKANRPIRSVMQDPVLLEFARRPPKQFEDIQRVRGVRADQAAAYGKSLLKAIEKGLALSNEECPKWPSFKILSKEDMLKADVLFLALKAICYELDLASELIATRGVLEDLLRDQKQDNIENSKSSLLHGWRRDIAGNKIISLLQGAELTLSLAGQDKIPIKMDIKDLS